MTALATPVPVSKRVFDTFGAYVGTVNLNLGCGGSLEEGFINLDRSTRYGADVEMNLELCGQYGHNFLHLPGVPEEPITECYCASTHAAFMRTAANTVDLVLASHVLEHITNLIPLMREIHRVLKPGGHLCLVSPYASSDDAWEDPTHVRAFTEQSFRYFDRRLYEKADHAGHYPSEIEFIFETVKTDLIPFPDTLLELRRETLELGATRAQANLEVKRRFMRNVIKELQVVLRKVE